MATHSQGAIVPNENTSKGMESRYCDVLVIGRCGIGKSTLANKLLGINPETKQLYKAFPTGVDSPSVIKTWDDSDETPSFYFEIGHGSESVTKRCKLLSNEATMSRVLDVPGFTDVDMTSAYGAANSNWQCLCLILRKQKQYNLQFSRVVYFMPSRGPPERADGTLQEELKALYSYFGKKIFDIMVIAVTNNKHIRYQEAGFLEEDFKETMEVFMMAFEGMTGVSIPKCPPIVYIPFTDDHQGLLHHVTNANVISDAEMLAFSPEFPIDRDVKVVSANNHMHGSVKECKKCAKMIITKEVPNSDGVLSVISEDGGVEDYNNSSCHPLFVPKYSRISKIIGGIVHVLTFGLFMALCYSFSWPGFTNSEEVCVQCMQAPRTEGCSPVNKPVKIHGESCTVDHETS